MRFARVKTPCGPLPVRWGDGEWLGIDDVFAEEPQLNGERYRADSALAAPVDPRVVLGMAHNSAPGDVILPPQAFAKSARTIVGPGEPIVLDMTAGSVVAEAELAVVLRRHARNLRPEDVAAHILGYSIGNDVTAVEQIEKDSLLTQAKNGDGFTPVGPWIETELDAVGRTIRVETATASASGSVEDLARGVTEILVYVTRVLELGAGDVVLTGCPGTAVVIRPGDTARASIDGLGELVNPVTAAPARDGRE